MVFGRGQYTIHTPRDPTNNNNFSKRSVVECSTVGGYSQSGTQKVLLLLSAAAASKGEIMRIIIIIIIFGVQCDSQSPLETIDDDDQIWGHGTTKSATLDHSRDRQTDRHFDQAENHSSIHRSVDAAQRDWRDVAVSCTWAETCCDWLTDDAHCPWVALHLAKKKSINRLSLSLFLDWIEFICYLTWPFMQWSPAECNCLRFFHCGINLPILWLVKGEYYHNYKNPLDLHFN